MVVRAGSGRRSVEEWLSTLMRPELGRRLLADPRADRFAADRSSSKEAPPPRPNTSSEIARYCRLRDVETKHQQFAVDAWCAPEHIVPRHTADQVANFGIDSRPTTSPDKPKRQ